MGFCSIETWRQKYFCSWALQERILSFFRDARPPSSKVHLQKFRLDSSKNRCHGMALGHLGCLAKKSQLTYRELRPVKMMMEGRDLRGGGCLTGWKTLGVMGWRSSEIMILGGEIWGRCPPPYYGVATIIRLLKIVGLFCRISSLL